MWVWQNGSELVDRRTRRLRLTDPPVVDAVDAYAALIHRHRAAPPLAVVSEAGFAELFRAGKVAMFMGGAADDLDRQTGLEVVVREVPTGPGGRRATFAWSAGLHISAAVNDPPAAFAAYKAILERIHRWKIPAPRRPLAARLEEFEPRKAPAAEVIRRSMEYMRCPAGFPRQVEFDTLFREEFEEPILRTGRPAGELAAPAARVLERLLR
jgi:multiple sugar transport system substrate-binding protein